MNKFVIKNATIVNEGKTFIANLYIEDQLIKRISTDTEIDKQTFTVINASGKFLLPGVIDTHVHFRTPGFTYKANMASESMAAVAGGVTSIADMPNTMPQTTNMQYFTEKYYIAQQTSLVNFSFYIGATDSNLNELEQLDPKKVIAIKIFMGSSTGNMSVKNETIIKQIFKNSCLPIVAHCEDDLIIQKNIERIVLQYGENPPFSAHPMIRNEEACFRASEKAVELATKYNTKLHIAHISTKKELALLNNNLPISEKTITGETCIQYLWFSQDDYIEQAAMIKCNPAIKTKNDRDALRNALNNKLLDTVATDHAPHTLQEKSKSYFESPSGIPLIQHSLPAMLQLVNKKVFTIETVVEKMCHNPALLFNIEKRGFIKEGFFADLVLVDMNSPWQVNNDNILYKCQWSPFVGTQFDSKIVQTFVNGNLVWDNGIIHADKKGQQLIFNR